MSRTFFHHTIHLQVACCQVHSFHLWIAHFQPVTKQCLQSVERFPSQVTNTWILCAIKHSQLIRYHIKGSDSASTGCRLRIPPDMEGKCKRICNCTQLTKAVSHSAWGLGEGLTTPPCKNVTTCYTVPQESIVRITSLMVQEPSRMNHPRYFTHFYKTWTFITVFTGAFRHYAQLNPVHPNFLLIYNQF